MINDVITFNGCIDHWKTSQCGNTRFDEKGHETQLDAVLLDKGLLVAAAQCHDLRQVDLVEGGEHGRRVLGLHHALGDARP